MNTAGIDAPKGMTYAIMYLRPDGWWEAGRWWHNRAGCEEDAREHFKGTNTTWRVILIDENSEKAEGLTLLPGEEN